MPRKEVFAIVIFLFAVVWTSSSSQYNSTYENLGSVLRSNCTRTSRCYQPFYECCDGDCRCCPEPFFRNGNCLSVKSTCIPIGSPCRYSGDCCGRNASCEQKVCREYLTDDGLDFMTVAKVALASALLITMIAVCSVCWKAFIHNKCGFFIRGSTSEEDTASLNSVQRFVVERMQDRPPRYDVQPEKPPSYEECFAEPNSSPPPYTVAIGIGETSSHISSRRPPPYYMSDLVPPANLLTTPLNVQSVRLMEEPSTDDLPSPVQNMEDFAALTESESACSLPYDSLHSDSQTIVNSQESSEQQDDSLALFSWNSCTEVASESSDSFNPLAGIDNTTFVPDEEIEKKSTSTT